MGSSDLFELPKEYKPGFEASFGSMQKQSCFSVKIEDQGNFSLKTGSVQVVLLRILLCTLSITRCPSTPNFHRAMNCSRHDNIHHTIH
jgi:hypothetical protein